MWKSGTKRLPRQKGVCEFYVRRSFPASSLFPFKGSKKIRIEADAFQDVVDEIQPDVIACDIEGIEKEVFAGANLSSVHRLVVEVHPQISWFACRAQMRSGAGGLGTFFG